MQRRLQQTLMMVSGGNLQQLAGLRSGVQSIRSIYPQKLRTGVKSLTGLDLEAGFAEAGWAGSFRYLCQRLKSR